MPHWARMYPIVASWTKFLSLYTHPFVMRLPFPASSSHTLLQGLHHWTSFVHPLLSDASIMSQLLLPGLPSPPLPFFSITLQVQVQCSSPLWSFPFIFLSILYLPLNTHLPLISHIHLIICHISGKQNLSLINLYISLLFRGPGK